MKKINSRAWMFVSMGIFTLGGGLAYWFNSGVLIIAPMLGGLNACLFKKNELVQHFPNTIYTKACLEDETSASVLVERSLRNISKNTGPVGNLELGYTLNVPLLHLFELQGSELKINKDAVNRIARTIRNVDRPVVLYLFSDHFEVDSPVERALAKNPDNMLVSKYGPMAVDYYYGSKIYPWTFTNIDNQITQLREVAVNAVLNRVCYLPLYAQKRVAGVTMLGELHHMFPDFQGGMGFSGDYVVSDYSERSIRDFRLYLASRYISIDKLNTFLGASFSSFDDVNPPKKDIRKDSLNNYWEHMDAYAHGILPVAGWVAGGSSTAGQKDWIHLYNNGEFLAKVPAAYGRQDVLAAHPELASSDVGWQFNWRYSDLPPGIHTLDIYLARGSNALVHLGSRQISIMERSQATPRLLPIKPLPQSETPERSLLFQVDQPVALTSYYFNPLAVVWHDFRKYQVSQYLAHFANVARKASKCINPDLIYSHQILPFVNPGWDETKFAVGRDLAVPDNMRMGISLYGEASYGSSFFDWFKHTQRSVYGITEFHPLKAMNAQELNAVFLRHHQNNAQFLSFFAESIGWDEDPANKPNMFSFEKKNKNAGSDVLFESIKEIFD